MTGTDRYIVTPYFLDKPLPGLELPDQVAVACRIDAPDVTPGSSPDEIVANLCRLHRPLADAVAEAAAAGDRPVSVAGDCCAAIAVLAGLQRAGVAPTLIWLDAHGDFNTFETTPSGFLGGMPLAMLVGRGDPRLLDALGVEPLPEERVILSDARDLDPGEREALAASRVRHVPRLDALPAAPLPFGPLYVHFDIDLLDPADAPAVAYPAPGGPSLTTVRQLFVRLATSGRVAAVSVSAWNPDADPEGKTRERVLELVRVLLG